MIRDNNKITFPPKNETFRDNKMARGKYFLFVYESRCIVKNIVALV